jgi:hypothetical protein
MIAVALAGLVGAAVVLVERAEEPAPDLSWPAEFAAWHRPALLALVLLAAAAYLDRAPASRRCSTDPAEVA